jgi:hypothetical protein
VVGVAAILALIAVAGKSLPDFLCDTRIGQRTVETVSQTMKA